MPDDPIPTPPAPKADDGKTFTQAEVDALIDRRFAKEKAKYADYDELKAKAGQFDALDASSKTETQKLNDRITAAEQKVAEAESKALRMEVASAKGIKPRWLTGNTREELEASAEEYLTDHPPADPKAGGGAAPSKPTEALSGGGDPTQEPDETDPRKLAAQIPRT